MSDDAVLGKPMVEKEQELAPFIIEGARSSRSKCKLCRKKIEKEILRLGILIEGPYGTGYLWHHLNCAAKHRLDDVEEAYNQEAWKAANEVPAELPEIEELQKLNEEAQQKRRQQLTIPYIQIDPSGRAKCKNCGDLLEKGKLRIVLGREIEFGTQYRTMPIHVHPKCVLDELDAPNCNTSPEGFAVALQANSTSITNDQVRLALAEIGETKS